MTVTTEKTKVNKAKLLSCLSCKLCQGILREATTVSECLHSFCWECIYNKITEERLERCPVCSADLGRFPEEKLKPDRTLQDLTKKLLPSLGEKENAKAPDAAPSTPAAENVASVPQPETQPSVPEPTKRKERSLSSIAAKTRKQSSRAASLSARRARAAGRRNLDAQESSKSKTGKGGSSQKDEREAALELVHQISTHLSERRAKAAAKKKLAEQVSASADEPPKVAVGNENGEKRSVIEILDDNPKTGIQNNAEPALSLQNMPQQNSKANAEVHKEKPDTWNSLNFLVGAASNTKSRTLSRQGSSIPPVPKFSVQENSITSVPKFSAKEKSIPPVPKFSAKEKPIPPAPKFSAQEKPIPSVPVFNMQEKSVAPAPMCSMKAVSVDSSDEGSSVPKANLEMHNEETNLDGGQDKLAPQEISLVKPRKLRSTKQRKARMCQDLNLPPPPPPTPTPTPTPTSTPTPPPPPPPTPTPTPTPTPPPPPPPPPPTPSTPTPTPTPPPPPPTRTPTLASSSSRSNERITPFWFSLVASQEQEVDATLPQIPSRFLRVNDGSLPVSYIQRYLKIKLGLASDDEVEILLRGYQVLSSWQLQTLVDLWQRTVPSHEKIQSFVGNSAEDFVMVLSYRRRFHI